MMNQKRPTKEMTDVELREIWEDEQNLCIYEYVCSDAIFYLQEIVIDKKYKSLERGMGKFCELTEKEYKILKEKMEKMESVENKDDLRFILEDDCDGGYAFIVCLIYRKMTLEEFIKSVRNGN